MQLTPKSKDPQAKKQISLPFKTISLEAKIRN